MIKSRLTGRHRTTIPRSVRDVLDLRIGDEIAYIVAKGRVVITRARPATNADPFAVFHEWAGDADGRAYAEL